MKISQERIYQNIHAHFNHDPEQLTIVRMGSMTLKYEFWIKGVQYIIRFYPKSRKGYCELEFKILQILKDKNCAVPVVLFYNKIDDFDYLIYQKLKGITLFQCFKKLSKNELDEIIVGICNNIQCFSQVSFNFFGNLNNFEPTFKSWKEFLVWTINDSKKNIDDIKIKTLGNPEKIYNYMLSFIDKKSLIVKPTLVWSDFNQENIIIDNHRFEGIIDFESCISGDPLLSLGYLYAREGDSDFFNIVKKTMSLNTRIDMDLIYFYALFRIVRILKYANSPLPNGIKRENPKNYFKGLEYCLHRIDN